MSYINPPQCISPNETLGRGVFDSNKVNKKGNVRPRAFLERQGEVNISVDRLDFAEPKEMATLGDTVALGRGADRRFYGWATLAAKDAASNGRQVVATPLPDNSYHADIVLPDSTVANRDEQIRHAQELADASRWRERPDSTKTD